MRDRTILKICGLSTASSVEAAIEAGADMLGFVFFPPSPRNLALDAAAALASRVGFRARTVALTVDAGDALIDAIMRSLKPDVLQLHGRETPQRAAELRARTGAKIMKALGVSRRDDLAAAAAYRDGVDYLLFDAKPPKGGTRPGGNARVFDWSLLDGFAPGRPWLLSGGLDPSNVRAAMERTHAPGVDVSSGVESAPGVKDEALIRAFGAAVRGLS